MYTCARELRLLPRIRILFGLILLSSTLHCTTHFCRFCCRIWRYIWKWAKLPSFRLTDENSPRILEYIHLCIFINSFVSFSAKYFDHIQFHSISTAMIESSLLCITFHIHQLFSLSLNLSSNSSDMDVPILFVRELNGRREEEAAKQNGFTASHRLADVKCEPINCVFARFAVVFVWVCLCLYDGTTHRVLFFNCVRLSLSVYLLHICAIFLPFDAFSRNIELGCVSHLPVEQANHRTNEQIQRWVTCYLS